MPADPLIVETPKDVWTKVATNVTSGFVWVLNTAPNVYSQTYRLTGEAAPTLFDEAVTLEKPGAPISASVAIDVYIRPIAVDGSVRVDV